MKISIVVPCRNESKYIAECIDTIFKCDLPNNSELNVFIVDGMSDDGTRQIVLDLMENYPFLYLIDNLIFLHLMLLIWEFTLEERWIMFKLLVQGTF